MYTEAVRGIAEDPELETRSIKTLLLARTLLFFHITNTTGSMSFPRQHDQHAKYAGAEVLVLVQKTLALLDAGQHGIDTVIGQIGFMAEIASTNITWEANSYVSESHVF